MANSPIDMIKGSIAKLEATLAEVEEKYLKEVVRDPLRPLMLEQLSRLKTN